MGEFNYNDSIQLLTYVEGTMSWYCTSDDILQRIDCTLAIRTSANKERGVVPYLPVTIQSLACRERVTFIVALYPKHVSRVANMKSVVFHSVRRSITDCRNFYTTLLSCASTRNRSRCTCYHGVCPFWGLHAILLKFKHQFKASLSQPSSTESIESYRLVWLTFIKTILYHVQSYRQVYFLYHRQLQEMGLIGCKVLLAIDNFFDINDDIMNGFKLAEEKAQGRLKLDGWQIFRRHEANKLRQIMSQIPTKI